MSTGKISVVVMSGSLERLQTAAMVTSVAAVSGNDVRAFLTMNALPHFIKGSKVKPSHEGEMGALMASKKVPDFKMLFQQAVELGDARICPCTMAMDVLGLDKQDLESYLAEPTGLTKFIDDSRDGQVWTF